GVLQHRVGHHLRAEYVGFEKVVVVVDRSRDVCFGGKVHDDIGFGNQGVNERRVAHIAVPELEPVVIDLIETNGQVLDAAGVGQQVEDEDAVIRVIVVEIPYEVAPDESCSAHRQNRAHRL